jgi:hypothetical protein
LKPGGVYTKEHLQVELDNITISGMFEKMDMEGITQRDGTMKLKFSFLESQWQSSDSFHCINVGLLAQPKPKEVEFNSMYDVQKERFIREKEQEYRRHIRDSRSCILPKGVEREIQWWLRFEGRVTARILQRIRDRVQKWNHDQGYAESNLKNIKTTQIEFATFARVLSRCLDKHKLQIFSIDLIPGRFLEVELDRSTSLDPICNTCSRSRFVEFRFRFVASYGFSMSSKSSTSSLLLHLTFHGITSPLRP